MNSHYDINWLLEKYENGESLKFIYFWGNTKKDSSQIDKSCFSQWYDSPFEVADIIYKTAEHWMMAQKALLFNDKKAFDKIVNCEKPGEAKEIGRGIVGFDDIKWNDARFDIVKKGNIYKFNQHPLLADYLIKTDQRILVEASPQDTIWGVGLAQDNPDITNIYTWRGENLLGFVLMEVRDFLKEFGHFGKIDNEMLPPWTKFPEVRFEDMFWKMGQGEDYILKFYKYYSQLTHKQKVIYELIYPQPYDWIGFYE